MATRSICSVVRFPCLEQNRTLICRIWLFVSTTWLFVSTTNGWRRWYPSKATFCLVRFLMKRLKPTKLSKVSTIATTSSNWFHRTASPSGRTLWPRPCWSAAGISTCHDGLVPLWRAWMSPIRVGFLPWTCRFCGPRRSASKRFACDVRSGDGKTVLQNRR